MNYLFASFIVLLAGCQGSSQQKSAISAEAKVINPLLDSYIAIQKVLANDKIDQLSQLAAQLLSAVEGKQDKPGIADIVAGAGRLATQDIETARLAFKKISTGIIAYLVATPQEQVNYQLVYCPMAFDNTGAYWVQEPGEIVNPYHGLMMLHCGEKIAWDQAKKLLSKP